MNSPVDTGDPVLQVRGKNNKTVRLLVMARFEAVLCREAFPLLVTLEEGTPVIGVTEPWTGMRVCPVAALDMNENGQVPLAAGRQAFDRLVACHGAARIASALRRQRATTEDD